MNTMHELETTQIVLAQEIGERSEAFKKISQEIHKTIMGQEEAVSCLMMALLCKGHILLEGVPGVAKTSMIKALTNVLGLNFKRIQFTPDLLPSDLVGTLIYNPKTLDFETKKGPIFANLILADEINRAPAKVQAALLEAMQEQQVTIGSQTFLLDQPFLVCATQNPIEQEGTYRLPEAQLDRFFMKIQINYPAAHHEKKIIAQDLEKVVIDRLLDKQNILELQALMEKIYVDERIIDYIVALIQMTRSKEFAKYVICGASPRATQALFKASRAHAFIRGRYFVTPDDIKSVAVAILQHRLIPSYEAQAEGLTSLDLIKQILKLVPTP